MSSNETPLGQALVLCDQVIVDKSTEKKTLVGIFNNIWARQLPCSHHSLTVYVALSNGHGRQKITLKCLELATSEVLFSMEGEVEFANPNAVIELVFNLRNTIFKHSGIHTFEVLAEGHYVFESRFNIEEIEQ